MAGVRTLVADVDRGYELNVVALDPLRASICAVGEFDVAAKERLAEALREQEDAGRRFIRVDLSQVTFIDCSCLGILVAAHHRLLRLHGLLVLAGVDPRIKRVLEIAGLVDSLFLVPAGQDPFDSVLMARAARRRIPNQPQAAGDRAGFPSAHRKAVS